MFERGFAAGEAEYLLRLGALPDNFDRPWTNAEVAAYVDAIHVGIEVASSPFPGSTRHGPAVTVSDFGNNNGLVVGAEIPRDTDFLCVAGSANNRWRKWPVRRRRARCSTGRSGAVRFLFELAASRQLPLAPGQWISTGAVTGVHPVRVGELVEARFAKD